MGKRKGGNSNSNSKGSNGNQQKKTKYSHVRRFWIEQCKTRKIPKSIPSHLVLPLVISRVELTDDHMHAGKSISKYIIQEANENEKARTDDADADGDAGHSHDLENIFVDSSVIDAASKESEGKFPKESVESEMGADIINNKKEQVEENRVIKEDTQKVDENGTEEESDLQSEKMRKPFVQVVRVASAQGKIKIAPGMRVKELPDGDCGDGIKNPFPKDEVPDKYWAQRKRLFSKYDEGIQLDNESWYSVTPEAIATHIAQRISAMTSTGSGDGGKKVVLDVFCGVGGNAIAFALHEDISLVICVDIDRNKLKMAANNASKYGVDPSKLLFVEGNAIEVLRMYDKGSKTNSSTGAAGVDKIETCHGYNISGYDVLPPCIDSVFLSPPWGGVDYLKSGNAGFELATCITIIAGDSKECDGKELLELSASAAKNKCVIYFLPKNVNGFDIALASWMVGYRNMEMEQNCVNGKLKTVTVYLKEGN